MTSHECANCGYPYSEHHYNGACYGICGKFVRKEVTEHMINLPAQLHPATRELLKDFVEALGEKLHEAQRKYKYTNEWSNALWKVECQAALKEHMEKGDPLDVAAYCAFMWNHDWSTS